HGAGDVGLGVEPAGVDRGLQAAQIDDLELAPEQVLEAALGQAAVQRHLAALEALDGDAGARLLALDAAARGLAQAGADAAAQALLAAPRARIVADLVQPHRRLPRARWGGHTSGLFLDPHQMMDGADHAAHRRRVLELAGAVQLV